jgi:hypothetical protein
MLASENSGPAFSVTLVGPGDHIVVAGYVVTETDGRLVARSVRELSDIEREHGCLAHLVAGTSAEMLTLLSAEAIKRDMLARAQPT